MEVSLDPQEIKEGLACLPTGPGVYLMKDGAGKVIYVGKARRLRARIRSYFRGGDGRAQIPFLMARTTVVDTILTETENEAVLLENTLIKKFKPRYNFMLRSDITYFSIRMDPKATWPRFEIVRKRRRDGALYLGPYPSGTAARETLKFIHRFFPLRQCADRVLMNRSRPCILYDIGKCCAPCCLDVSRAEYAGLVEEAVGVLRGRHEEVVRVLRERMLRYSERMEFEKAAELRDRIVNLEATVRKQRVALAPGLEADCLAHYAEGGRLCFAWLAYRDGLLNDTRVFVEKDNGLPLDEIYNAFITQFYGETQEAPPLLLTAETPFDEPLLAEYLGRIREGACEIRRPQRGDWIRIVEIARANARDRLSRALSEEGVTEEALRDLSRKLNLSQPPRRIECYDISTFGGSATVASRVVFLDGKPAKDDYRRYRVKTVEGTDDFASMREVLSRRFRRLTEEDEEPPDLVIVDGGLGQLAVAVSVLEDWGVGEIPVAGLAKSRLKETADPGRRQKMKAEGAVEEDEAGGIRTAERLFLPGRKNPVVLKANHASLFLVQRIRDEAHRFAITYHKKTRHAATITSALDMIPGVGPSRRRTLLKRFGSLSGVRKASLEELTATPGVSPALAQIIFDYFSEIRPAE